MQPLTPLARRASLHLFTLVLAGACAQSELPTKRRGSEQAGSGGQGGGGGTTSTTGGNGTAGGVVAGSAGTGGSAGTAGTTGGEGGGADCSAAAAGDGNTCGDACPDDPDKTEPGECGCGIPDVDTATVAGCTGLRNALVHRYSFTGTGTDLVDSVGEAHGTAKNVSLSGNGLLTLSGSTSNQYGALPSGIVSALTNASFEAWLNWTSTSTIWQRIFDFGVSDAGAGAQGKGDSYLFLAPKTLRFCYRKSGEAEIFVDAPSALPGPATTHVVAVFDDANNSMKLYVNGTLQGSGAVAGSLSEISDESNWLGRSQYSVDPEFGGSFREFRIYDATLTQAQVQASFEFGEAPAFLDANE